MSEEHTDARVTQLTKLRDNGTISEKDYKELVLAALDGADELDGAGVNASAEKPEEAADRVTEQVASSNSEKSEDAAAPSPSQQKPVSDNEKQDRKPWYKRPGPLVATIACAVVAVILIVLTVNPIAMKPENTSEAYWEAGKKAVQIAQDYKDAKITSQDAADRLSLALSSLPSTTPEQETKDNSATAKAKASSVKANDEHIRSCITYIKDDIEYTKAASAIGASGKSIDSDLAALKKAVGYH
jgi:hypothetical protein